MRKLKVITFFLLVLLAQRAHGASKTFRFDYTPNWIYSVHIEMRISIDTHGRVSAEITRVKPKIPQAFIWIKLRPKITDVFRQNKCICVWFDLNMTAQGRAVQIPLNTPNDLATYKWDGPQKGLQEYEWNQNSSGIESSFCVDQFPELAHAGHFQIIPPQPYEYTGNTHEAGKPKRSVVIEPLTSTHITTSLGQKDRCKLLISVTDNRGKPARGLSVIFKKPNLGHLTSARVITDLRGQAIVTYIAPTEKELAQTGKTEINIPIEATEAKSGQTSRVEIHVRSQKRRFATRVDHEILPAHPDYYNRISFAFKADRKPDASPYKALITIKRGGKGALVKNSGDKGGVRKLELVVFPYKRYSFYYHWVGPTAMMKAYDEAVTIEIPELQLRKTVQFSVGVDLMIESVQMKYGPHVFPVMFEPFNIYIKDNFHPKADLVKLFKDLDINIDLKINQVAHVGVPPDPTEHGILEALMTAWEGSSTYPHVESVVSDGPGWGIKKTRDGRYILWSTGKGPNGKIYVDYPGIDVFERGTYQFEAAISPGKFDADPRNNKAMTDTIEIKDFPYQGEELFHTVFLPSVEFLLTAYGDLLPEAYKADKLLCAAINIGITTGSMETDLKQGNIKKLIMDIVSAFTSSVGVGVTKEGWKLSGKGEALYVMDTIALYGETLLENLVTSSPQKQTRMFIPRIIPTAWASEKIPGKKFSESDVFKISQLMIRGTNKYFLLVLNKTGINSYEAKTRSGIALKRAPSKLDKQITEEQRIYTGRHYTVIPFEKSEKALLKLTGNGKSGNLTVITPSRMAYYEYPSSKWESVLEIDASGNITTKRGMELKPASTLNVAGTWNTNFGKMVLTQHGNVVTGRYTHDNGRIEGFLQGNRFTGKWKEAPTYRPSHDAGECEFLFSGDGASFKGHWRYGFGGKAWSGGWSGKKIK